MHSAVTISLVPEARGGPFVFWDDLAAGCQKAAALGYDAVEVFPRSPQDLKPEQLQTLLSQHGLKLAAIGSGSGWVAHKLRLTDANPDIRRRAREFAAGMIDLAGALRAPIIIGSMQGRWEGGVSREQALGWFREAVEELASRAAAHHTGILIESLNRYETNLLTCVDDGLLFLNTLGAKNVQLLCDLFHMNIEEASIAESLRKVGARLGHVHFVDSNRRAVGAGHTEIQPIAEALREIGYTGYISAEILPWPDSETAAAQSIASFRRWFRN